MPFAWRVAIAALVVLIGTIAYLFRESLGPRVTAAMGIVCFLGIPAALSSNLRAVNLRTLGWGMVLQVLLAVLTLKVSWVRAGFKLLGSGFKQLIVFSGEGSKFVFGQLADRETMSRVFPNGYVPFALAALPPIVFIASFFSVLYYLGLLQLVVRGLAWVMRYLMQTSGAETLSVSANVFMGQTEAPLIVRPYIAGMTQSEMLTMMVGGMAHISGGLMAVYMSMGAEPVGILATSVMAAPCSLYLSKLLIPETGRPATAGLAKTMTEPPLEPEDKPANVIDAAAAGASEGMRLAINVAAMLIAFIAFIALANFLLTKINPDLSLEAIFARVFAPAAVLIGVEGDDIPRVAELLGTKLSINEFVAYAKMGELYGKGELGERSRVLATYALTGFANFGSIGIQIGGIGAMAPKRRGDLARLGLRALLVGFLVTLINAAIAGLFL
jgi:concentrative nucleoside transporter, CNT family